MYEEPSLFQLDYMAASRCCMDESLRLATATGKSNDGKPAWQFKQGFDAYNSGVELRRAINRQYHADGRRLWRLGWLAAMFLDLQHRPQIIGMDSATIDAEEDT